MFKIILIFLVVFVFWIVLIYRRVQSGVGGHATEKAKIVKGDIQVSHKNIRGVGYDWKALLKTKTRFLGSMLPQYMALCISLCVSQKNNLGHF